LLPLAEDQSTRVAALVQWGYGGIYFTTPLAPGGIVPACSQGRILYRRHLVVEDHDSLPPLLKSSVGSER